MAPSAVNLEFTEYRVVFIEAKSRVLLLADRTGGCRLPRVHILKGRRPVEQLRRAIKSTWGLQVLILDLFTEEDALTPWLIAELIAPLTSKGFETVLPGQLSGSELSEREHFTLCSVLAGKSRSPFTRIGWLDEAAAWIEAATGHKVSKSDIEQLNGGGAFALVRFHADDSWNCWMKATGEPNTHELSMTSLLSRLCKGYVPEFLGSKPEWNAWLMAAEGTSMMDPPATPFELFRLLEDAVESMAELQIKTIGAEAKLLGAGAFDQRLDALLSRSDDLFDFLDEVIDLSASRHVSRQEKARLRQIRMLFQMGCERLWHLNIPATIVHGDMNPGNMVTGCERCQFIDWSEAYLGHCFVTLEHLLLLLNSIEHLHARASMKASLQQRYASVWATVCSSETIEEAFRYMPLMAAVSTLLGRGEWLNSPKRYDARHVSYARTLATYMDRAMRTPELQEALYALRPAQLCVTAGA